MKSLFSDSGEKRCERCLFSAFDSNSDTLLCEKKGLVPRGSSCFRFRYDPLKRAPRVTPDIPKPAAEELTLDVVDGKEAAVR